MIFCLSLLCYEFWRKHEECISGDILDIQQQGLIKANALNKGNRPVNYTAPLPTAVSTFCIL